MTVPVWIEQSNGKFIATVLGAPQVKAEAPTKEQAVAAVTKQVRNATAQGQVVFVDVGFVGVSALAGKFKDDPTLEDIVKEAYRERDAQKAAEFPE
jgi:hypothetical protein